MQSERLKSNRTLRLSMAVIHRISFSMLRVSSSTCVSNLQERSLIREIYAEKRAKNYESMQLPNGTLRARRYIAGCRPGNQCDLSPIERSPYLG